MTKTRKQFDAGKCLELALEGERLCKSFELDKGITQFKCALECGTNDERILSAIFCQLGNAYFYKKDFENALKYHDQDLKLSQLNGDLIGESKACGNIGNTFKMLEQFDKAIHYCTKHLEIARSLKDQVNESRALYNLGNVYHTKGKLMAINSNLNMIDFPAEIKECLLKAIEFYKLNLELMKIAGDRDAQGRSCGNIGNVYYLLGEFQKAIQVHNERLQIAKECGDKEAERRAYCNLGNAYIFCGEFEKSIDNYKQSLFISQEIGNQVLEAQAYFSIGNAYFLLKDYKSAIGYFLEHLKFAQELKDKLGQSRACWSLGNAYNELNDTESALLFANYHLQLAKEINDKESEDIASKSVIDLKRKLEDSRNRRGNLSEISNLDSHLNKSQIETEHNLKVKEGIDYFQRKQENPHQISSSTSKLIEVVKESEFFNKSNLKRNINYLNNLSSQLNNNNHQTTVKVLNSRPISEITINKFGSNSKNLERAHVAVLNHYQTPVKVIKKRLQNRQSMENMEIMKLTSPKNVTINETVKKSTDQTDNKQTSKLITYCEKTQNTENNSSFLNNRDLDDSFLDILASYQSKRMDDQRCSLDLINNKENHLPDFKQNKARKTSLNRSISTAYNSQSGTNFEVSPNSKEMKRRNSNPSFTESTSTITSASAGTQEGRDELFDLIEGIQSRRMDEQRALLPPLRRSYTAQETVPKPSSTSSSIDSQQQQSSTAKYLHRMSTNVEVANDQVKHNRQMSFSTDVQVDDDFFDMLMKSQSSRIEDQRSTLPSFAEANNNNNNEGVINQNLINNPRSHNNQSRHQPQSNQSHNNEEILNLQNLLMRCQSGRLNEQRSTFPNEEQDLINLNSSGSNCSNVEEKSNKKKGNS